VPQGVGDDQRSGEEKKRQLFISRRAIQLDCSSEKETPCRSSSEEGDSIPGKEEVHHGLDRRGRKDSCYSGGENPPRLPGRTSVLECVLKLRRKGGAPAEKGKGGGKHDGGLERGRDSAREKTNREGKDYDLVVLGL